MKKYLLFLILLLPLPAHALTEAELLQQLSDAYLAVTDPQQVLSFNAGGQQITEFEVRVYSATDSVLAEERVRYFVLGTDAFYARRLPSKLVAPSATSFSQEVRDRIQAEIVAGTIVFGEIVSIEQNRAIVEVWKPDNTQGKFLVVKDLTTGTLTINTLQ